MENEESTDLWSTPKWLFEQLDTLYGPFDIDACAIAENTKCPEFIDEKEDCLKLAWHSHKKYWMNPPYSNPFPFVEKAAYEAMQGVVTGALLPADHSVRWYQKFIETNTRAIVVERFPFRIRFDPPAWWRKKIHGPKGCHVFVLFRPSIVRP